MMYPMPIQARRKPNLSEEADSVKLKTVFVHTIVWEYLLWLLVNRKKIGRVFYVSKEISDTIMLFAKRFIVFEQVDTHLLSHLFVRNEENKYIFVEKMLDPPVFYNEIYSLLSVLNTDTDKLITAFKKHLIPRISADIKVITLAQELGKDYDEVYAVVDEYLLLEKVVDNNIKLKRVFRPEYAIKKYFSNIIFSLSCLKKIAFAKKTNKSIYNLNGVKIIFEQMYEGREGNPEFEIFYRYFKQRDDVLYICLNKDSEIYKALKNDIKQVIARNEIYSLRRDKINQLKLLARIILRSALSYRLKSGLAKRLILQIFCDTVYYDTLLRNVTPMFYLKVRSDIDPSHPIATALSEKYKARHIGYQHGSYCYFTAVFSHIDFHYYGLLGRCFSNWIYSKIWPKNIQYRVLGPLTTDSIFDKDYKRLEDKFTIGIFTSLYDNIVWKPLFKEYLEIVCSVLKELQISGLHLIFKEKGYSGYSERLIVDLCNKYALSYQIAYHLHPTYISYGYSKDIVETAKSKGLKMHLDPSRIIPYRSSSEIVAMSDINVGISPAYNTIVWEALGLQKKVISFGNNIAASPIEKYLPLLVVRNREEFKRSISWLAGISQEDYKMEIRPVIDNCCKVSNGKLVEDFIESIEEDICHNVAEDSHLCLHPK